VLCIFRIKA